MGYDLVKVTAAADWRDYHLIRRQVLWEARSKSGYDESHADEYIPANHPLLLKLDGRSIATTRLDDFGNGNGAVRLVAVAAGLQRQGHGRVLSALTETYAYRLGVRTLFVNAAPEAIGYYDKMGWENYVWDMSELAGFSSECVQMRKAVAPPVWSV